MIKFKLVPHLYNKEKQVIEVWEDRQFIATITAADSVDRSIKVISKFTKSVGIHAETVTIRINKDA